MNEDGSPNLGQIVGTIYAILNLNLVNADKKESIEVIQQIVYNLNMTLKVYKDEL